MFPDNIAYCGVDCHECVDFEKGFCPGCRKTEWTEDEICPIVACCKKKGVSVCGECPTFPCGDMKGFYDESESHRRALARMRGEPIPECHPSLLRLASFEGSFVRVTCRTGEVLEGRCEHNSADYGECELGRREESLQMLNLVVYSWQIEKVELLDETGPWAPFSAPFGRLEEELVTGGADLLEDSFDRGEPEHEVRLLRCIRAYLDGEDGRELEDRDEMIAFLGTLANTAEEEETRREAKALFALYRGE